MAKLIRMGERAINLDTVTEINGLEGDGAITVRFNAAGEDDSLTFEAEEAEAIRWYLQRHSDDALGQYREYRNALAQRETARRDNS